MSLRNGYLKDHAGDMAQFTGWVGDDFWGNDMVLDNVPGFSKYATIEDVRTVP